MFEASATHANCIALESALSISDFLDEKSSRCIQIPIGRRAGAAAHQPIDITVCHAISASKNAVDKEPNTIDSFRLVSIFLLLYIFRYLSDFLVFFTSHNTSRLNVIIQSI